MPNRRPTSADRLDLSALIDLEVQLAADERLSEAHVSRRDAELGPALMVDAPGRRTLLARWVNELAVEREGSPGRTVERAYRHASALLGLVMFIVGLLAAFGVFHFTGDHPI